MVPPVPIPNTVVKHINAEGTWLETAWEIRELPVRERLSEDSLFFITDSNPDRLQTNRRPQKNKKKFP